MKEIQHDTDPFIEVFLAARTLAPARMRDMARQKSLNELIFAAATKLGFLGNLIAAIAAFLAFSVWLPDFIISQGEQATTAVGEGLEPLFYTLTIFFRIFGLAASLVFSAFAIKTLFRHGWKS